MMNNEENGVETFLWKGIKMYRCPETWESGAKCEYNTHNLINLREHIAAGHGSQVMPQPAPKVFGAHEFQQDKVAPEFIGVKFAQEV